MAIIIKEMLVRTTVERGKSKVFGLTTEWRTYIQQTVEEQLRWREKRNRKKEER